MSTVTVFSHVSAPTQTTIASASLPVGTLLSCVVETISTSPASNNSIQFPVFALDITETSSSGTVSSPVSTILSPTFQTPVIFTGASLTFNLRNISEGSVSVFIENM